MTVTYKPGELSKEAEELDKMLRGEMEIPPLPNESKPRVKAKSWYCHKYMKDDWTEKFRCPSCKSVQTTLGRDVDGMENFDECCHCGQKVELVFQHTPRRGR